MFQLELASKFLAKGFNVINFDDIQFQYNNRIYLIECKRLLSKRNVVHNINKAYDQLTQKITNDNEYGIIALSIDKLLDIDYKYFQKNSEKEILSELEIISNSFITNNEKYWDRFNNIHIVCIIIFLKFISVYQDDIIVSQLITIKPLPHVRPHQPIIYSDLKHIAKLLIKNH